MNNLFSWHGYGLAVDVIHRTKQWNAGTPWFAAVAVIFKRHGCKWGGDWKSADLPHFQWGLCKPSPSDTARQFLRTRGVRAVWEAVGAMPGAGG
jgi:peptidoglycan L-alanyl-D-glutamate endopeptidase CwlK